MKGSLSNSFVMRMGELEIILLDTVQRLCSIEDQIQQSLKGNSLHFTTMDKCNGVVDPWDVFF